MAARSWETQLAKAWQMYQYCSTSEEDTISPTAFANRALSIAKGSPGGETAIFKTSSAMHTTTAPPTDLQICQYYVKVVERQTETLKELERTASIIHRGGRSSNFVMLAE